MFIRTIAIALFAGFFTSSFGSAATMNKVKAGELVIDPPTLINLGFEWVIQGDDNRNATVDVAYRRKGDTRRHPPP